MAALPLAAGCLFGGFLMERVGRRRTSLLIGLPALTGWVLMAIAQDLNMLLVGRFLTGFSVGAFGPVGLVYIGETSSPKYRGVLLAATAFSVALGILLSHLLGALLDWRTAAGLCTITPALGLVSEIVVITLININFL
jgi:facilitated trehalose transporter